MAKGPKQRLLFVDTNKFLDFYRAEEAGISLLGHLDKLHDHTITTFQVEMEFKKHRVGEIAKSVRNMKFEGNLLDVPAFLRETRTVKVIRKNLKDCKERITGLQQWVKAALDDPPMNDEVYIIAQRLFADRNNPLNLHPEHSDLKKIRQRAMRRFFLGYPPRKNSDTSCGDAINWEWILECVRGANKDVVVVSRDADYGTKIGDAVYPNDWLATEVKRINKQRKVLVFHQLSEALKELNVKVSAAERDEEEKLAKKTLADLMVGATGATGPTGPQPMLVPPPGGYSGYSGATGPAVQQYVDLLRQTNPYGFNALEEFQKHLNERKESS